jgi:hypothetical protein
MKVPTVGLGRPATRVHPLDEKGVPTQGEGRAVVSPPEK